MVNIDEARDVIAVINGSKVRLLANSEPIEICGTGRMSQANKTDNQASVILNKKTSAFSLF